MGVSETLLKNLGTKTVTETFTVMTGIKLGILAIAGVIAVYILPKFPYWFDEWIDRFIVIDFDEDTKREFSKIIRWSVYLVVLYLGLYILGFKLIHTNPLFQLIVLIYGVKVAISVLKPSVKKIDRQIKNIQVSEGSILMKIMIISVYVIGLFIALSIVGLKGALTTALAGAGVLGLVIGFGAKDIVANTLSGIFLAIDKPFAIEDVIKVKGEVGIVRDMGLRTTEIEGLDNKVITFPNSYLANNPVINYTANELRRISVKVGVNYNTDIPRAMKTIKEALEDLEAKEKGKEVNVLVDEFGDSAIILEARLWFNQEENGFAQVCSEAKETVLQALREKDIDIPFPTRVIIEK